jgi:septal ring factor EnvC (AmiA/AmiB activator)
MRVKGWSFPAILLLAFLAFSPAVARGADVPDLDSRIKDEQSRLEAIEKQITFHQKQIGEARKKEQGLLDDLSRIDQSVTLLRQKVALLDLQRKKTEQRISELTSEIESAEIDLARTRSYLAKRFEAIYKYGGVAEYNLLLSSGSTNEALNNAYLLARMAREDERRILFMKDNKMRLESSRKEMLDQKALLVKQKGDLEKEQTSLKSSESQRKESLDALTKQKTLHQKAARELEESQKELQSKIHELMAQKRKAQEARAGVPPVYLPSGGKLSWPVRGEISSQFGTRVHPVFKTKIMHTGLDIRAPAGTPVKAAAAGEVLFAGWLRGYGQIVILDHGRDLSTVYAHLSQIRAKEGKVVKEGEVIGNVGSTGVASGPHLHFEVRVNGEAKNPASFLGR